MAFLDTILTQFAEFMGSEIKRVENKIPTSGSSQPIDLPIITGAGRPDKPDTTGGKIKGDEPNGTVYISNDGAGVGAWKWIKTKNKWEVVYGDTGDITMPAKNLVAGNWVKIRRYNNLVILSAGGGQWGWFQVIGKASQGFYRRKANPKLITIIPLQGIKQGFRTNFSILKSFYNDDGVELGKVYVAGNNDYNYIELRFNEDVKDTNYTDLRFPDLMWYTTDPFPETL